MAKQTGMPCALYTGGYDVGGDTQSFVIHGGPAAIDTTDITQSAFSRLGGLRTAEVNWVSYFDTAALASHAALSPLPTTDVITTALIGPIAIGCPAVAQASKQINYDGTRAASGEFTLAVNEQSQGYSQEWGVALTSGKRTDTTATAGTAYDNGAGFTFGAQAYLQVFAFSGTDVTIAVQHCTTSGGSYADLIAFTQINSGNPAPLAQRAVVSNVTTVNEFLKVTTTTSSGFTSVTFAVMVVVNTIAGQVF